jgi:hypothetical protein
MCERIIENAHFDYGINAHAEKEEQCEAEPTNRSRTADAISKRDKGETEQGTGQNKFQEYGLLIDRHGIEVRNGDMDGSRQHAVTTEPTTKRRPAKIPLRIRIANELLDLLMIPSSSAARSIHRILPR